MIMMRRRSRLHETPLIKDLCASGVRKDMEYLMLGGYIVGRMTFCIMYLRLRSFFVTASALKSRRTPRLGFRNLGFGV